MLSLSQADPDNDSGKARKPREAEATTHDVRPPCGVLVAHLEEISVALSFSLELPAKQPQVRNSSRQFERSGLCDEAGGKRDVSLLDAALFDQNPHQSSSTSKRPNPSTPVLADGSGLDDDTMLDTNHSSQEPALFSASSQNSQSGYLKSASHTSLLDDVASPEQVVEKNKVSIESLAKLIDASFRTMIYGKKSLATRGIRLTQGSQGPTLAEIAAPVFSPGYLPVSYCPAKLSKWLNC